MCLNFIPHSCIVYDAWLLCKNIPRVIAVNNKLRGMFEEDRKKLSSIEKRFCHRPEDDRLDHFYQINVDGNWKINSERKYLVEYLLLSLRQGNFQNLICETTNISFNFIRHNDLDWKDKNLFLFSKIKDLSTGNYNPLSLQHIAAAGSIKVLEKYDVNILLHVYNLINNKIFSIRAGEAHSRRNYDSKNIVKDINFDV